MPFLRLCSIARCIKAVLIRCKRTREAIGRELTKLFTEAGGRSTSYLSVP